jgi:photosystem II stability/assembly factor-like uncharacterized protein
MSCLPSCLDPRRQAGKLASIFCLLFFACAFKLAAEAPWSPVGPAGGDARSFAAVPGQPDHLYVGTTNSWIYESTDGGASWQRLAKLDTTEDLVLDHIVVDSSNPTAVYVAAWKLGQAGGGLWVSRDGGRTWSELKGLHGQSIRAFVQAPSASGIFYAGTLQGVFRSDDSGATWKQISPVGSSEIHEVESLAVDPRDPQIVYAGTWHLPWKTNDGGAHWHSIKKGLIVDSDVFSIIVDPARPRDVFLSACSGIYKSESAGELFRKIQGIPNEARRTRVIAQDPGNRKIVYAGTTEGLYKTLDGGRTFRRMTGADVIINDVYIDPRDSSHVLLATDRSGVLSSADAAASFSPSNTGFSERKVEALLIDRKNPSRLYAGVVNDKEYGGVFVSDNGGAAWQHIGGGLDGLDVYALAQAPEGTILAGTSQGIFALEAAPADDAKGDPPPAWKPMNTIANTIVKAAVETLHGKRIDIEKSVKEKPHQLDGRIAALDLSGDAWVAAGADGLFTSRDKGATWQGGPVMGADDYLSVTSHDKNFAAARPNGVVLSRDGGLSWFPMQIPLMLTRIHRVSFSTDGTLWLGAREGVFFTHDLGKSWQWIQRLPLRDIDDLWFDAELGKVLVSSRASDQIFAIDPKTLDWKWWQTGYDIALIRATGQRIVAASLYDGVVLEPQVAGAETSQR